VVDGRSFLPNVCELCIVAIYMVGGFFVILGLFMGFGETFGGAFA
jgi:hypothetical protein